MSERKVCAGASRFTLRLFDSGESRPPAPPDGLSDELTVRLLYQRDYREVLESRGAAQGTFRAYEEAIGYWESLTPNPRLKDLVERDARGRWRAKRSIFLDFVKRLQQQPRRKKKLAGPDEPRLSATTVRKHCAALRTLLDRAGPATVEDREGLALVETVPYSVLPPASKKKKPAISAEEFERLILAAQDARLPFVRLIAPAVWWIALLTVVRYSGLRIGTAMKLRWGMIQNRLLQIPAAALKRSEEDRIFPFPPVVRDAFTALGTPGTSEELIFAFPDWPDSQHNLQKERRRLLRAAGIPTAHNGFHSLRRRYLTEMGRFNKGVEAFAAGHSNPEMTNGHYIQQLELLAECQEKLEVPQSLRTILREGPRDRQRRLFE